MHCEGQTNESQGGTPFYHVCWRKVLCDGLKQIVDGKKYDDVTVHYIDMDNNGATLQSFTLLLSNQDDLETANYLFV